MPSKTSVLPIVFDASKENMSRFSSRLRKEGTIFRVELNGGCKPVWFVSPHTVESFWPKRNSWSYRIVISGQFGARKPSSIQASPRSTCISGNGGSKKTLLCGKNPALPSYQLRNSVYPALM